MPEGQTLEVGGWTLDTGKIQMHLHLDFQLLVSSFQLASVSPGECRR